MNHYRNEITILRALAVISVILFHAKIPYLEGGYLGVDVFFVISGFLIYGNIQNKIQEGKFSFQKFYISRLRRLFPALIFVLVFTTLAAFAVLLPYDLKNYGQSLFATLISANNFLLLLTSGYWSMAADFKPLYHTWSLAVEEQFYLIGPILFLSINKFIIDCRIRLGIYSVVFVFSLYSFASNDNREYSFLMPHTRAWELLAGVISFYFFKISKIYFSRILFIFAPLGFTLIVTSFILGRNMVVLPTILSVLGASLIMISHVSANFWTGNFIKIISRPFIFVGLISYSLYLWHQPVLAYTRYMSIQEPTIYLLLISFVVMFVLAFGTWKFVEEKFRIGVSVSNKKFINSIIIFCGILVGIGLLLNYTYGLRKFSRYDYGENPQSYVDGVKKLTVTNLVQESFNNNIIVLGNSFARDFVNVLKFYVPISDFNIKYYQGDCELLQDSAFRSDLLMSKYIFYSENWASDKFEIAELKKVVSCSENLSKISPFTKVTVVGVKNFGLNNGFVKVHSITSDFFVKPKISIQKFNSSAINSIPGYLDIISVLKDDNNMVPIFDGQGNLLTYDTNHLTSAGAKHLSNIITRELDLIFGVRNENSY